MSSSHRGEHGEAGHRCKQDTSSEDPHSSNSCCSRVDCISHPGLGICRRKGPTVVICGFFTRTWGVGVSAPNSHVAQGSTVHKVPVTLSPIESRSFHVTLQLQRYLEISTCSSLHWNCNDYQTCCWILLFKSLIRSTYIIISQTWSCVFPISHRQWL